MNNTVASEPAETPLASPQLSTPNPQPTPTPSPPPIFPRAPGETPRAFTAFMTFFQLGSSRSLQAVADKLGEGLPTVKNWSSKYDWSDRLQAFNSGLLQQQAQAETALHLRHAADWAQRLDRFREQDWDAAQKLLAAAQCFLESFGEQDLSRMTLAQVSHALEISSAIGRFALAGARLPEPSDPVVSPVQQNLLDALKRVYSPPTSQSES